MGGVRASDAQTSLLPHLLVPQTGQATVALLGASKGVLSVAVVQRTPPYCRIGPLLGAGANLLLTRQLTRGDTVNPYLNYLMTQERCQQRIREANAERLAHEINDKSSTRTRLVFALRRLHLGNQRTGEPRLET